MANNYNNIWLQNGTFHGYSASTYDAYLLSSDYPCVSYTDIIEVSTQLDNKATRLEVLKEILDEETMIAGVILSEKFLIGSAYSREWFNNIGTGIKYGRFMKRYMKNSLKFSHDDDWTNLRTVKAIVEKTLADLR